MLEGQAFASYQLLAAVREGDYGVNSLNQRIERVLQQQGLISVNPNQRHYIGMPIMVSQKQRPSPGFGRRLFC